MCNEKYQAMNKCILRVAHSIWDDYLQYLSIDLDGELVILKTTLLKEIGLKSLELLHHLLLIKLRSSAMVSSTSSKFIDILFYFHTPNFILYFKTDIESTSNIPT